MHVGERDILHHWLNRSSNHSGLVLNATSQWGGSTSILKGVVEKKDFGFLVEFPCQSLYFYLAPYTLLSP